MVEGIQFISDWLSNVKIEADGFLTYLTTWVMLWWFKVKLLALEFWWGIGQSVLASVGISSMLENAWGHLNSNVLSYFTFFRIPEALNILLNAYSTKFVMKMFGASI